MTEDDVYRILYGPQGLNADVDRKPGHLHLEEIIAIMQDEVNKRRMDLRQDLGGMRVPYHGDLMCAPPSTLKAIERWIALLERLRYEV